MSLLDRVLPDFVPRYRPGDEQRIEPPAPERVERMLRLLGPSERIHRYEVIGVEHVPLEGPALIVSPHAFSVLDIMLLGKRILERRGRLIRGLTDHFVFSLPGVRDLFTGLGVVDGTPENGERLLASGQLAACMPGGALDWSRGSRQRRTLRWGDHRGYARLAARTGVPVIPTACPAADDLFLVLNDGWQVGKLLRRALGTQRIYPLPVAVGLGPLPFPVKLTQHVAPPQHPLPAASEDASESDVEERARELDQRVRDILQDLLADRR